MRGKNAGYTLVELLISVTILAVIAIPLTHAFVSAARVNGRSRKLAQAQNVAQNVLEEVRMESWEDIENTYTKTTTTQEGSGKTTTEYHYQYDSIETEHLFFEAEISLSPEYDGESDDSDEVTDYNADKLPQIYDMNAALDATYELPGTEEEQMATAFGRNTGQILREMKREIYIDIRKSQKKTVVDINSAYTYRGITRYALAQSKRIYSNTSENISLRNVYLFFSPMSYQEADRERIVIRNWDSVPVNIYLVRQGKDVDMTTGYKVNVDVLEQNRSSMDYADVYTHLCTNLIDASEIGNTNLAHLNLRYGKEEDDYRASMQVTANGAIKVYEAANLVNLTDLFDKAAKERIYNVTVNVREKGADENEALVLLNGTKER